MSDRREDVIAKDNTLHANEHATAKQRKSLSFDSNIDLWHSIVSHPF
jgi:hypothetical protein